MGAPRRCGRTCLRAPARPSPPAAPSGTPRRSGTPGAYPSFPSAADSAPGERVHGWRCLASSTARRQRRQKSSADSPRRRRNTSSGDPGVLRVPSFAFPRVGVPVRPAVDRPEPSLWCDGALASADVVRQHDAADRVVWLDDKADGRCLQGTAVESGAWRRPP